MSIPIWSYAAARGHPHQSMNLILLSGLIPKLNQSERSKAWLWCPVFPDWKQFNDAAV